MYEQAIVRLEVLGDVVPDRDDQPAAAADEAVQAAHLARPQRTDVAQKHAIVIGEIGLVGIGEQCRADDARPQHHEGRGAVLGERVQRHRQVFRGAVEATHPSGLPLTLGRTVCP